MCVQCLVNVHPVWLFSAAQSAVYKERARKVSGVFFILVLIEAEFILMHAH
jgi:hypothetical protein